MSTSHGSDLEKSYSPSAPDAELGGPALRSDSEVEKDGGNIRLVVEDAAAAGLKVAEDGKVRPNSPLTAAVSTAPREHELTPLDPPTSTLLPPSLLLPLVSPSLQTVLVPQPSDDPRDPLNWTERKKFAILLVVAFAAFLGDFQSGAGAPSSLCRSHDLVTDSLLISTGIPLLEAQGEEWGMTPNEVNKAGNLCVAAPSLSPLPLYER